MLSFKNREANSRALNPAPLYTFVNSVFGRLKEKSTMSIRASELHKNVKATLPYAAGS